jgi:hypothetical protein
VSGSIPAADFELADLCFICGRRVRTEDLPYRSLSGRLGGGNQRKDGQPELRTIVRVGFRVFSGLSPFLGSGQDKQKKSNRANTNVHFNLFASEGQQKEFYFVYFLNFWSGVGWFPSSSGKGHNKKKKKKDAHFNLFVAEG